MARKRKVAKTASILIPFNKRGAALAYTLIAAMVLMILSTSLLTAAESNISVSTKNTEARRSYITCKSAVEYAKSIVLQRANSAKDKNVQRENDNLANSASPTASDPAADVGNSIRNEIMVGFNVKPDTGESGFKVENGTTEPDGKDILATCFVTLNKVTRTTTQAVTACDTKKNSDGSFPVTAQMQTVTSKLDLTKDMADSGNWKADPPELKKGSTPKTASTMTYFDKPVVVVLSVQDVYYYQIKIEAFNQYSASDDSAQQRMQQLNYETDCIIDGREEIDLKPPAVSLTPAAPAPQNPGTGMLAVGGQYGNCKVTNGNNLGPADNGISKLPVILKNEIISSGSSSYLSAPAVYFMNSESLSVSDALQVPLKNDVKCATIDSDFIYFNGNIKGILDTNGNTCSAFRLINTRNSLKLSNGYAGIVQFSKMKIQLAYVVNNKVQSVTTKELPEGLYYFKDGTNLFDESNPNNSNLMKVPETDYAAIRSVANQDYVDYLKSDVDNIVSSDSDGAKWLQSGDISNSQLTDQTGKTVYCYVNNCSNWINTFNNHNGKAIYKAKNIVFQWDNASSALTVPENDAVTFQADYMAINTNQPIKVGNSSSKFIVANNAGTGTLTMAFSTGTVIQYAGSSYTIKAGTYGKVPCGINLFSSQAKNFFADPANRSDLVNHSSVPDSPGKSSIQLDSIKITLDKETLFKKGKYTNE